MKDKWNEKYNTEEFIFGEQPNIYLKEQLINYCAISRKIYR